MGREKATGMGMKPWSGEVTEVRGGTGKGGRVGGWALEKVKGV